MTLVYYVTDHDVILDSIVLKHIFYLQVTLNAPSLVRGVATQGRHVNPNDQCCYQYVKKYRVMYSLDCVNFETVKDRNGNDKVSIIIGLDKQMFVKKGV